MAFQYLTNIPLEQAKKEYVQLLTANGMGAGSERMNVTQACGRTTARAVYAHICAPHYHASAMDGIAVQASDTFGATQTTPVALTPEQYVTLDTGDPIPENCDAVIMVEDIVKNEDGSVRLYDAAAPWQHIRQIGEDICAGEMILPAYTTVSPSAIGALLAGGVMEIDVLRQPIVGIIPTGDEIIPPTSDPAPGDIIEFNSSIFSAMLRQWGALPVTYPIVPDRFDQIKSAVSAALSECDMVILNAGSSAGREDYSAQVIRESGGVLYHGIAMKPGKPAILGYQGAKAILGVPGYPVSGIIVIEQLLKPLIEAFSRHPLPQESSVRAFLSRPVVSGLKYQEFVRVRMGYVDGRLIASPLSRGSGVVSSFMKADGILTIPQGLEGYEAGSEVTVQLLRPQEELKHTLVAIGSHDPLLDEVSDLLHRKDTSCFMASTHTGSMGGIMAVRRKETHIAGIHLLDENDGTYNESYVRKYFPQGGVRLVECVGRTQGIMAAKGNPKNITGIDSLTAPGIRYVNRQKGSGTRILMDYLCKKNHLDTSAVYGYDREEFTHTSVAAQIASGSADAGMGIYSAAKMYDLSFIPVCTEQYDLLIPDSAWDTPLVQELIRILKSDAFAGKLKELGGYTLQSPGEIRCAF
ncbi:MAG TPA: molybdopterin biosynthesis protein [Lachnospiraceae bacterium]|nr:molybdopterin biosynthesis protein [Lachnospiraceae bacterium]